MASSHHIVTDPFTTTLIRIKARQLCRRTDFSRSEFEDLQQDMRAYLLSKAHLFDPARGNLEAFVTNAVKTWVAMELRYRSRDKRRDSYKTISIERTAVESDGDLTALGIVLLERDGRRLTQFYGPSRIELFELREATDHVMGTLEPRDRALLTCVAEHGVTGAARELNISRRQVTNALARLRPLFEAAGLGCD